MKTWKNLTIATVAAIFGIVVFGMTVVGCDTGSGNGTGNGNSNGSTDTVSSLNGTWIAITPDGEQTLILNNGNMEVWDDGFPYEKGIYTTSEDNFIFTVTQFHGSTFEGLESKWYTKTEMATALTNEGFSDADVKMMVNNAFAPPRTVKYSVNGNKMTFTGIGGDAGQSVTYTKK